MIKNTFFISTSLEMNFYSKKKILAGNWCFKNFKEIKEKNHENIEVIKNSWSEEKKLSKDYKYLMRLSDLYSNKLSNYLNSYNNCKFSKRFWKILLLPWLTIYLPSQYYRWKVVKEAIQKANYLNFFSFTNLNTSFFFLDTIEYHHLISSSSEFNYSQFKRLLEYLKKKGKKINFIKKKLSLPFSNERKSNYNSKHFLNSNLINILNYTSMFLTKKNDIFIEKEAFKTLDNMKINFFLKQFPTTLADGFNDKLEIRNLYNFCFLDKKKRYSYDLINNKKIKYYDEFANYIDTVIRDDIPICFLEGFNNLKRKVEKINLKPKIILSSYNHYYNELFKLWIAHLVENKISKLFIVSHGSGYIQKYETTLDCEQRICDKKINWVSSNTKNAVQLPASKFLTIKNYKKTSKYLCFAGRATSLFPEKIGGGMFNFGTLQAQKECVGLLKNVNNEIKKKFIYIPMRETNWDTTPYLKKYFKPNQIAKKNSFKRYINKSRLVICSYPQTAFSESILSVPTILLCDFNQYVFKNKFKQIHKKLVKYKIAFNDPKKAALHINEIWNKIDEWWYSREVKNTINDFIKQTCPISNNAINIWVKFLNNEIEKN